MFLFLAIAALLAAAVGAAAFAAGPQVAVFVVAALILPTVMRRRLLDRLSGRGVLSRTEALFGESALVTESIDPQRGTGRVMVNGTDWAARGTESLAVGTPVEIHGADGIVLLVARQGQLMGDVFTS